MIGKVVVFHQCFVFGCVVKMPEFLALIIDTNPLLWSAVESRFESPAVDFTRFFDHISAFIGMYLGLDGRNRLLVMTCFGPNETKIIADSARLEPIVAREIEPLVASGMLENVAAIVSRLTESVRESYDAATGADDAAAAWQQGFNMAGAVGRALCYLNKHCIEANETQKRSVSHQHSATSHQPFGAVSQQDDSSSLDARIFLIKATRENQHQYIDFMNSVFAAQKLAVPIDVCNLGPSESVLLQQAADLTSGAYLSVPLASPLLPYLSWTFLSPVRLRVSKLNMPKQAIVSSQLPDNPNSAVVDYRPSCFCHRRLIDVGFVCSTCMSVFCTFTPVCRTCLTTFKLKSVK